MNKLFLFGIILFWLIIICHFNISNSAFTSGRRRREKKACHHQNYVEKTLNTTVISLFGYEYKNLYVKINNTEFCKALKTDWFHNSTMISRSNIDYDDLHVIADYYLDLVYNEKNFPYTYRAQNESYILTMNFTDHDIRKYYRLECPFYDYEAEISILNTFVNFGIWMLPIAILMI